MKLMGMLFIALVLLALPMISVGQHGQTADPKKLVEDGMRAMGGVERILGGLDDLIGTIFKTVRPL